MTHVETCRYGLQRVPVEQLLCETCHVVGDEFHVVMECTLYDDIRKNYLNHISGLIPLLCSLLKKNFFKLCKWCRYHKATKIISNYILQ